MKNPNNKNSEMPLAAAALSLPGYEAPAAAAGCMKTGKIRVRQPKRPLQIHLNGGGTMLLFHAGEGVLFSALGQPGGCVPPLSPPAPAATDLVF